MTTPRKKPKPGPGRPRGTQPDAVREALLQSARELFSRRDFQAVSLREIATQANVNPAMVHYYFGNKKGLYTAMADAVIETVLTELQPPTGDSGQGADLAAFLHAYVRQLADNPWLPNLVVREVLYGDEAFRRAFVERFPLRIAEGLIRLIGTEQNAGRLRADLDPRLAVLSLISMAVFPFIAGPVVEQLWEHPHDTAFADRLADHILKLFYEGAAHAPAAKR